MDVLFCVQPRYPRRAALVLSERRRVKDTCEQIKMRCKGSLWFFEIIVRVIGFPEVPMLVQPREKAASLPKYSGDLSNELYEAHASLKGNACWLGPVWQAL